MNAIEAISERMNKVERRISQIEVHLNIQPEDTASQPNIPDSHLPTLDQLCAIEQVTLARIEQGNAHAGIERISKRLAAFARWRHQAIEPSNSAPALPPAPPTIESAMGRGEVEETIAAYPPKLEATLRKRPSASLGGFNLELQIGTRWVAWIGAILLVMAAGFFAKLAYDNQWIRITPAGRCLLLAAFGSALIGCGEWCIRRISRASAVGLYGAGLGVLYLTSLASYRFFDLVGGGTAFFFLALVGAVGVALTIRARMLTIGGLSLVGGYLAPLLLRDVSAGPMGLPTYISVVFAVALLLSAWRESPFRPLRGVAIGLHAAIGTLWLLGPGSKDAATGMAFLSTWWAMVLVECIGAARREQSANFNATGTFAMTLWLALVGCRVLASNGAEDWLGAYTFLLGCVAAILAVWIGVGLDGLRSPARNATSKLAASFWVQCGILLATAVGLQFDQDGLGGIGRTIGWLSIGLACVELARYTNSNRVELFGAIVGGLGLMRLALVDCTSSVVLRGWAGFSLSTIGGFEFSTATLLLGFAIVVILAAIGRLRVVGDAAHRSAALMLATLAGTSWLALASLSGRGNLVTILWVLPAFGLFQLGGGNVRRHCLHVGAMLLGLSMLRWLAMDALGPRLAHGWTATSAWPVLNGQVLTALLLIAACWLAGRSMRRGHDSETGSQIASLSAGILAMAAFGLIALSFELDRAIWTFGAGSTWPAVQHLTLWLLPMWAMGGVGLVFWGRQRKLNPVVLAGNVLTLFCCFGWLLFGALLPRLLDGPMAAMPIFNLQFVMGCCVAALALLGNRSQPRAEANDIERDMPAAAIGLAIFTALVAGSLEIDRSVAWSGAVFENPAVVRLMGLSIYWGLFSLGLIGVGFARTRPILRHFGLGLLGLTLGKVMLVDLAGAQTIYRVLSLLALGLALIVTSIAYARLAKRYASAAA